MNNTSSLPHCAQCQDDAPLAFDFSFAFQPIVDTARRHIVAYEALARGIQGEPAATVFQHVNDGNRYRFDQACRVKAVKLASELGLQHDLNINFYPNAVYEPARCLRTTLDAAQHYGFPVSKIVFEITEGEKIHDSSHLLNIVHTYHRLGFRTAFDDFGADYSGLNLLAQYQPDMIKLDRALIANIHQHTPRQAIVRGILSVCRDLNIVMLAEGVELREEYLWLAQLGITLFQGYYFARPAFECLPDVDARCY